MGHGLVDVFDPVTHTFTRLVTGSAAGGTVDALNSPWGMALAPSALREVRRGPPGRQLRRRHHQCLRSDHRRVPRDPQRHQFGNPLVNPGLWGLTFGNGGNGGDKNTLYFTAGGADEASGVFGQISAVPEPGSLALGLIAVVLVAAHRRSRNARS